MQFRILFIWIAVVLFRLSGSNSYASSGLGAAQFTGSFVSARSSSFGGELGAAWVLPILPEKGFWMGPRFGAMWESGNSASHLDYHFGGESAVWFVNAVAMGLAADVVTNNQGPIHYRAMPFISARLLRFQKEGAWAIRVGIPYDTLYHLGLQVGLSLQLNGVPTLDGGD